METSKLSTFPVTLRLLRSLPLLAALPTRLLRVPIRHHLKFLPKSDPHLRRLLPEISGLPLLRHLPQNHS